MNFIVEAAKFPVIGLAELKWHLRIEHDHEDEYLIKNIEMATSMLENHIECSIIKKKYKFVIHCEKEGSPGRIALPMREVDDILSVKQKLSSDNLKSISFSIDTDRDRTFVLINDTKFPIEIEYTAGAIEQAHEIPGDLRYAVLQIAKNIYSCRDEDILESIYVKNIINKYRSAALD
ncbi:MAG: head-tail connector protein [Holosporales bacterium]|jgi:uncharacterized phiE125 gp8 family phage protein|nr:head-tail connector protein [Holosporales bacterium]